MLYVFSLPIGIEGLYALCIDDNVPVDIRETSALNSFKKQLNAHLKKADDYRFAKHDPLEDKQFRLIVCNIFIYCAHWYCIKFLSLKLMFWFYIAEGYHSVWIYGSNNNNNNVGCDDTYNYYGHDYDSEDDCDDQSSYFLFSNITSLHFSFQSFFSFESTLRIISLGSPLVQLILSDCNKTTWSLVLLNTLSLL